MTGSCEKRSPSFVGLFGQFIACLGRSKVRDSQPKNYPPSHANAEEQLETREKYVVTPGRGCTCNETISSRRLQTNNVQHTTCDMTGLFIGTEDTNKAVRASYTPVHHEGGSKICGHMQDMRVTKVISIFYKECALRTATLYIELDVNGWRKLCWQEYRDLINTPGETEVIPGAKDAIETFGPMWRY